MSRHAAEPRIETVQILLEPHEADETEDDLKAKYRYHVLDTLFDRGVGALDEPDWISAMTATGRFVLLATVAVEPWPIREPSRRRRRDEVRA